MSPAFCSRSARPIACQCCSPIRGSAPLAAVHAGWRGALARIIEKSVGEMRRVFGSRPTDLLAVLGPSIRACCYEVGPEVVDAFTGRFAEGERFFVEPPHGTRARSVEARYPALFLTQTPPGHARRAAAAHLDLVAVAHRQLISAGVSSPRIAVADFCTACRTDLFFSHRREGGQTGRMMAVIGIRAH
jgi:purine-nucleoside/S-methyl-5'-thioadenosine phosphorylase / adenosine deaminase